MQMALVMVMSFPVLSRYKSAFWIMNTGIKMIGVSLLMIASNHISESEISIRLHFGMAMFVGEAGEVLVNCSILEILNDLVVSSKRARANSLLIGAGFFVRIFQTIISSFLSGFVSGGGFVKFVMTCFFLVALCQWWLTDTLEFVDSEKTKIRGELYQ